MKRCPSCNRSYTDTSLNFCLEDGTPLVADPPAVDPNATMRYPSARDTAEPPPTEIYRPETPVAPQPPPPPPPQPQAQPQWTPTPPPRKKSNAIWWILGGLAAIGIIGVGLVVMIIALASMSGTNTNANNGNVANRNENRNTNTVANTNATPSNTNSNSLPSTFADDFSEEHWGTGDSRFGRIWYQEGEYHMSSKEKTYIVMYAPSDQYSTENATVQITARSVTGSVPSSGFGLMVHCAQSKAKHLEDYALLIYPAESPEYEVIMHKDGVQTSLINRTKSNAIFSGSASNRLEIRIKGTDLSFYVNGQYLNRVTDSANYKVGRVGLYTSDVSEVAFDDLEIDR